MRGVIKSYSLQKHYGFIQSEKISRDIFFRKDDLLDRETEIKPKSLVEFVLMQSGRNSYRAEDVILIHPSSYWEKLKI